MAIPELDFATALTTFDTEVQAQYQNSRSFQGACAERHGSRGEFNNVPIGGLGEMSEIGFSSANIPVSSTDKTQVQLRQRNFAYKTVIGGGEMTLFAYDRIAEEAREHGMAAGRWHDFLLLDAIYNDAGGVSRFAVIDKTVGINTGLNVEKLSLATDTLADAGVNSLHNALVPVKCRSSLKKDPTFSSWDYNMKRPLQDNKLPGYLDIAFFAVGSKGANAIPFTLNGTTREYEVPVFGYDAIRIVFNREVTTKIWYNPGEDRTELVTAATATAKVIQTDGVVIMNCDTPAVAN